MPGRLQDGRASFPSAGIPAGAERLRRISVSYDVDGMRHRGKMPGGEPRNVYAEHVSAGYSWLALTHLQAPEALRLFRMYDAFTVLRRQRAFTPVRKV